MSRHRLFGPAIAILVALAINAAVATTPLDYLRAAPKPVFREGHTLPPLTRWGWTMPFEVRVELTENWGYALEFGGYATPGYVGQLDNPDSVASKLCALTASDPERYPLSVITHRGFPKELPDEAWARDAEGKLIDDKKTWSPEAPDEVFEKAAAITSDPLRKIREKAAIAIVLNGGEYALSVFGHHGKTWSRDPRVMKAKGERSWYEYVSARKAHQETIITKAVRAACPDRLLYIYYYADGCPHRRRYGHWWTWAWGYEWMRHVSDLPSSSIYYKHFNSGWSGSNDMLTQALNAAGQQIALGEPLSYNWVCGGWTRKKLGDAAFGDLEHYTGLLKCWYTAGMIGAVAGYFSHPRGGFGASFDDEAPSWLDQMVTLARVHALFSHIEEFLRDGYLLPGPEQHRWSKDLPAYEFPTGDAGARVLVRKHRVRPEWLIAAWAAAGGDREVTVTVPNLGDVTLRARASGSMYRATIKDDKPVLTLVDKEGMLPTAGMSRGPTEAAQ